VRVFLNRKHLNKALYKIQVELEALGLRTVQETEVFLTLFGWHYGYYQPDTAGKPGHIEIPAISYARLVARITGTKSPLSHILRHEYGHALAYQNRKLVFSKEFRFAFGSPHEKEIGIVYSPLEHLSEYAAYRPYEDFAETFAIYLKKKGELPERYRTEKLLKKWEFVRYFCHCVASRST